MRPSTTLTVSALLFALSLIVVAYVFFGSGSQTREARVPLVVVVRNPPALDAAWEGFKHRMEELGYVDGHTVRYLPTEVGPDLPQTKERVRQLLAQKPDLVFTMGVLAARAAKAAAEETAPRTPIVFAVVSNPVSIGLVESIQRPGGSVTGVTPASNLAASKRLELLLEMLPGTKRVIHPWNDPNTSGAEGLRGNASRMGLTLVESQVTDVPGLVRFLRDFSYAPGDAILRPADAIGAGALNDIITIALRNKIPLIGTNEGDTERGALMSYGANYASVGESAARMADMILRGTPPSEISVEEATQFYLSVNLDTAKRIGATIPQAFLLKAHRIIAEK